MTARSLLLQAGAAHMGRGPMPWLFGVAALGLIFGLTHPNSDNLAALCAGIDLALLIDPEAWGVVLHPGTLLFDWALMLIVMMPPLLAQHVSYVIRMNLNGRKAASVVLFLVAYFSTWILAGSFILPGSILLSDALSDPFDKIFIILSAMIWSASPLAQNYRNLCHRTEPICLKGRNWLSSNWRVGWRYGQRCVFLCWPWMMVPLFFETGHTAVMLCVALYVFADRLAPGAAVCWRVPPGLNVLSPRPRSFRAF